MLSVLARASACGLVFAAVGSAGAAIVVQDNFGDAAGSIVGTTPDIGGSAWFRTTSGSNNGNWSISHNGTGLAATGGSGNIWQWNSFWTNYGSAITTGVGQTIELSLKVTKSSNGGVLAFGFSDTGSHNMWDTGSTMAGWTHSNGAGGAAVNSLQSFSNVAGNWTSFGNLVPGSYTLTLQADPGAGVIRLFDDTGVRTQLGADLSATLVQGGASNYVGFTLGKFADNVNPAYTVDSLTLSVVPEPAGLALLAVGCSLLVRRTRR